MHTVYTEQGVALTGRNTTGPPSVLPPAELRTLRREVLQTTDDDDKRQRAKQYLSLIHI